MFVILGDEIQLFVFFCVKIKTGFVNFEAVIGGFCLNLVNVVGGLGLAF